MPISNIIFSNFKSGKVCKIPGLSKFTIKTHITVISSIISIINLVTLSIVSLVFCLFHPYLNQLTNLKLNHNFLITLFYIISSICV